ncbi:MAG: glutamine amidotransferase [Pseudomonadota bacterium]|nr:glutamine amidotransferase [Pseudomonadota bacterium]
MKPLLIIKAGEKLPTLAGYPGDFEDWMGEDPDADADRSLVVDVRQGALLPSPGSIAGAIVTGSNTMVTDGLDWARSTARWLREASDTGLPILGVCFGHQLLAQVLGGKVGNNPNGVEVGTVRARLTPDASRDTILADMPSEASVNASHRQAVLELPPGAIRLAATDKDANHAFRVGDSVWGVQFHPEFDREIVNAYVAHYANDLATQLENTTEIARYSQDTPCAKSILQHFHAFCRTDTN